MTPQPAGQRRAAGRSPVAIALLAAVVSGVVLGLAALVGGSTGAGAAPTCTKTWTAAVDGDWSDGTKWTPAGAPTSTADVCILASGDYTVTLHGSATVASLQLGATTGGTTQRLAVEGVGCSTASGLTTSGELDVYARGRLALTATGCGGDSASLSVGAASTVAGTLASDAGAGGARNLSGPITVTGTLQVDQPLTYSGAASVLTDRGTVTTAADLSVTASARLFNDTGTITTSGSGHVLVQGATFTQRAGTTSGNPVEVLNGALAVTGSGAPARFTLHNSSSISGDLAAGQRVDIEAVGCAYATTVTTAGGFTNAGSIHLTATGCGGSTATLVVPSATLVNSGTISADPGAGGDRYLRGLVRNTGTVLVDTTLRVDSGTLTNQGTVDVAPGQLLAVSGGGVTFDNDAGEVVSTGTGEVQVSGGAALRIGGGATTGSPIEVVNGPIAFAGVGPSSVVAHSSTTLTGDLAAGQVLTIEGVGCSYNTSVTAAAGFTNRGTIHLSSMSCGGASALLTVSGTLTNVGTLTSDVGAGGQRYLRGTLVNQGTLKVDATLTADATTITNQGSVQLAHPLDFSGSNTFTNASGTLAATGAGVLDLTGGATYRQGGGATTGNPVVVEGGTIAYAGSGSSNVVAHSVGTLSGDLAVGQTLTIEGVGCTYNSAVTAASSLTNAGVIHLSSVNCGGAYALLDTGAGTLTNTGTITVDPGAGGDRYLRGSIVNEGTLRVDAPITADATTITNEGTVTLTTALNVSGSASSFADAAGTVASTGSGLLTVRTGTYVQGGGTTTGNSVVVEGGTIHYAGGGASTVTAHSTVVLSGDIRAGQTLVIEGVGCSYNTAVTTGGASFTNAGTIRFTSTTCGGAYALLDTGAGTLTNTGTISIDPGVGGARYLRGTVENEGSLRVDASLTADATTVTNTGTVTLTAPMVVSGSGSGVANDGGSIDGSGSGALTVRNGTYEQGAGATSGNSVVVEGGTITYTGAGPSTVTAHSSVGLTGPIVTGQTLIVEAVGCSYNTNVTATGPLVNGGTIRLSSTTCGGAAATLTVPGGLDNTGTVISEPGAGGSRTINGPVDNGGTIDLRAGAPLTVGGNLVNEPDGTIKVQVTGPGSNGSIDVTGTATLGGTLTTTTTFTPTFGQTFPIMTYGGHSGTFEATNFGSAPYSVTYGPTGVVLSALKATGLAAGATPTSVVASQPVALTATLTVLPPETGTPTGTVTWFDGPTPVASAPLDGTGHASTSTSTLPVGSHDLVARYGGDATFGASAADPTTVTVAQAVATVALDASPNPADSGQVVTLTATVTRPGAATADPTGTVTFKDGSVVLGTDAVDGTGAASLQVSTLAPGTHQLQATYGGDLRFGTASSPIVAEQVNAVPGDTSTTLQLSPARPVATQAVTLTATVAALNPAEGTPTGAVRFVDGTQALGEVALDDGVATLVLDRGLRAGDHQLAASYLGAGLFRPSATPAATTALPRATATVTVEGRLSPSRQGAVLYTVKVKASGGATASPDGPVEVRDGDEVIADADLADGQVQLEVCYLESCQEPPSTTTTTTTTTEPATTVPPTSAPTTAPSSTTTTTTTTPSTTAPSTTTLTTQPEPPRSRPTAPAATPVPEPAPSAAAGGLDLGARRPGWGPTTSATGTHSITATYGGNADFDSFSSDPLPVTVDGNAITIGAPLPTTTTTTQPTATTTPATDPPPTAPPSTDGPPPTTAPATPTTAAPGEGSVGGSPEPGSTASSPEAGERPTLAGDGGTAADGGTGETAGPAVGAGPTRSGSESRTGAGDHRRDRNGAGGRRPGAGRSAERTTPRSPAARAFQRSTIARSVATPRDVSTDPADVARNLAVALVLVLLIAFPAHVFNFTLANNYDEVTGWFGGTRRRIERFRARTAEMPAPLVVGGISAAGALLFGLLDPGFGWNQGSLALFVGLLLALVTTTTVYDATRARYLRRRVEAEVRLRAYPAGVVVAALLVVFSRVAHFTPGYLFGVFTALQANERVDEDTDGRALAVASLALLALAVASWFVWLPVSSAADGFDPSFTILVLDALLSTLWIAGIQGVIFGLLPLRFLDGEKVWDWSKAGWIGLYVLGMFAFVHTMLNPQRVAGHHSFLAPLVLFLGFTLVSVAFWAYFRFRPERTDGPSKQERFEEMV